MVWVFVIIRYQVTSRLLCFMGSGILHQLKEICKERVEWKFLLTSSALNIESNRLLPTYNFRRRIIGFSSSCKWNWTFVNGLFLFSVRTVYMRPYWIEEESRMGHTVFTQISKRRNPRLWIFRLDSKHSSWIKICVVLDGEFDASYEEKEEETFDKLSLFCIN